MPTFSQTVSKVARDAEVASATVRMYENLGLIPCVRTTNGVRLFAEDAAELVRRIYTERLKSRGRPAKAEVR